MASVPGLHLTTSLRGDFRPSKATDPKVLFKGDTFFGASICMRCACTPLNIPVFGHTGEKHHLISNL